MLQVSSLSLRPLEQSCIAPLAPLPHDHAASRNGTAGEEELKQSTRENKPTGECAVSTHQDESRNERDTSSALATWHRTTLALRSVLQHCLRVCNIIRKHQNELHTPINKYKLLNDI